MILYFADRDMNIVGQASTELPGGLLVSDDKKVEEVERGTKTFECTIEYENRASAEAMTEPGNYLLRSSGEENEFYTIIDSELSTQDKTVTIYAEDAGLDLLNEIVPAFTASTPMTAAQYVNAFTYGSGFEIGVNEISTLSRTLAWESEATATERLQSIATQFDAELSFSFDIKGLKVTHKYINFWRQRGTNSKVSLRVGTHISGVTVKRSVANLATALLVTGATPAGQNNPVTLQGYSYDDGDIYVSGKYLLSRSALDRWARDTGDHISKTWEYQTTDQADLCSRAVEQLKKISQPETTYEFEIIDLPQSIRIGDAVRVIDSEGSLYIEARVLAMETSACKDERTVTLGDYLETGSPITAQISSLQRGIQNVQAQAARSNAMSSVKMVNSWMIGDFVHGKGLTVRVPVPGFNTVTSWSLTVADIFGAEGLSGWQNILPQLSSIHIICGWLEIIFANVTAEDYGFVRGDSVLIRMSCEIALN